MGAAATGPRPGAWHCVGGCSPDDPGALDDLVDTLSARYVEGQRSGHPVLPGAVELVTRLARVVPVAVVTNGPPDIQRLKIEQTGIGSLLSAVVISGETGIGKPDPASYGRALELLGVAPEHAVMVGDSWSATCRARSPPAFGRCGSATVDRHPTPTAA